MSSIVFIDSRVQDYERLITGFASDVQVIVLDSTRDGITQIAEGLAGMTDLDSIHIISHGSSGTLYLGSTVLTQDSLRECQQELARVRASLSEDGDILLYGCEVASGEGGERFIRMLAHYTDADIAASTDATGNSAFGGDWDWEVVIGQCEKDPSGLLAAQISYPYTLDVFSGTDASESLPGTDGDDVISGAGGNDTLLGAGGNDSLDGGEGNDSLVGGIGNDWFFDSQGSNTLAGQRGQDNFDVNVDVGSASIVSGGRGRDLYTLNPDSPSLVAFNAPGNDYVVTDFRSGSGGDQIYLPHLARIAIDYAGGNPFALGYLRFLQDGPDTLLQGDRDGAAGAVHTWLSLIRLQGVQYQDLTLADNFPGLLIGSEGDDSLSGGDGDDQLIGEAGNDLVVAGDGDDTQDGGEGDDTLEGGAGNDVLIGGLGADSMVGGDGGDLYFVDNPLDQVIETSNDQPPAVDYQLVGDTIIAFIELSFEAAGLELLEHLTLADGVISGTTNELSNVLTGNDSDNVLSSLFGMDTVLGGAGDDTLLGGLGDDSLAGGTGNDLYRIIGNDVVIEELTGGVDEIRINGSLSLLAAGVENLRIKGGGDRYATGNDLDNTIYANVGNSALSGGAGFDVVSYKAAVSGVNVSFRITGAQATGGSGSDTLTEFEGVAGSRYGDVLAGNTQGNLLKGGLDNDLLNGRRGADTLNGGQGADTFRFSTDLDSGKDLITGFEAGSDKIQLDNDIFTSLSATPGALAAASFYGAPGAEQANDSDDLIIYDTDTGKIYYDADSAAEDSSPILFARLVGAPPITAADFFIVA